MSLTLDEKQLIRSISDVIVHNPELVNDLLRIPQFTALPLFDNIKNVVDFAKDYPLDKIKSNQYYQGLIVEISKITDKEMKAIFESSLSVPTPITALF